jgi:hypothetical protein
MICAPAATFKRYTSHDYPRDWDLAFHMIRHYSTAPRDDTSMDNRGGRSLRESLSQFQSLTATAPLPKGMWTIPATIDVADDEKQLVQEEMRKVIAKFGPGLDQMEV